MYKIPMNTPVLVSLFNKVAASIKKRLQHRYFLVNFADFLRIFFKEHRRATAFDVCWFLSNIPLDKN